MIFINSNDDKPQKTPLTRHDSLKPLSREHHFGLLFCWKIRTGFQRKIAIERIKKYSDYFFNDHLKEHLKIEEELIFPLIAESHNMLISQALKDHYVLRELFSKITDLANTMQAITIKLNDHIRFEERILFRKIQENIPEERLFQLLRVHDNNPQHDNYPDKFWL